MGTLILIGIALLALYLLILLCRNGWGLPFVILIILGLIIAIPTIEQAFQEWRQLHSPLLPLHRTLPSQVQE